MIRSLSHGFNLKMSIVLPEVSYTSGKNKMDCIKLRILLFDILWFVINIKVNEKRKLAIGRETLAGAGVIVLM